MENYLNHELVILIRGEIISIKLSRTAKEVLKARYLLKNNKGKVIETPSKMFKRVAKEIDKISLMHKEESKEREFFDLMYNLDFLPNSPTLMNAGTTNQLSSCFVLPIHDSINSIFDALKYAAIIHKSGGGTGFNFSKIRAKNDIVNTTKGLASGPVSFMKIFDKATEIIKQGGKRRGANIGILDINHPDIIEFIRVKNENKLNNFNLSVAVTDSFMKAIKEDSPINLINPRNNKVVEKISAKKLFELIGENAWKNGDPGLLFIDEINRKNPLKERISAVNPCGEQPLLPYESCNLGSINLSNMIESNEIDFEKLKETIFLGVTFLDNVIDANNYPLKEIEITTKRNRKIGLGVMGFADMLIKLKIRYDSEEAVKIAEKTMKFIQEKARIKSHELAKERGSFSSFSESKLIKKYRSMRNATVTTIAPTGSISIIANTSSGIEPCFGRKVVRKILEGKEFTEINELAKTHKDYFITALEIPAEYHVRMQAAFQKYTDNAVSKTINLPRKATIKDVKKTFFLAHELKCKGVTVYRYGSKKDQVLECKSCEK